MMLPLLLPSHLLLLQVLRVVVVMVSGGVVGSKASPTSTFLMVAQDVEVPNLHTTIMTPTACALACYAAGTHHCLGFLWRPFLASTGTHKDECDKERESCGRSMDGRCGLLQCIPNPSSLRFFPGAQIFLLRGQNSPAFGSIKAPGSYTMACTFAYRVYSKILLGYDEAERRCAQDGAQLIAIKSVEQQEVVQRSIQQREAHWIGLSDRHKEGDWLLSDGSKPTYMNWDLGQPNNYEKYGQDQDCVMLFQGAWNDNQCDQKLRFICQITFLEL
nr:pulmonary surfactant-associated protein D-like [Procambarus clarkii]